jgi:hypothetical protein
VIENVRHNRLPITKDHGNERITVDIKISTENRIRVSLALNNGAVNALLKFCRDNANSFSSILPDICAQVNNAAGRLLKLAKADILIQSDVPSSML